MSETTISDDVRSVLSNSVECEDVHLRITGQLDRPLYLKINKVLQALGGKWNKSKKAHVFAEDAAPLIADAVTTGTYIDAKKLFQFYETPDHLARQLVEHVCDGDLVLEPSAGRGAIAIRAQERGAVVVCCEIQPALVEHLELEGLSTIPGDFLEVEPDPRFDHVRMNPPFCRSQDIRHVMHAHKFLRPGGTLKAIMSPGFTFREDRMAREFQDWIDEFGGAYYDLPDGTFKSSGTMVRTVLLTATR